MDSLNYRRVTKEEIDLFIDIRKEVLNAIFNTLSKKELDDILASTQNYFEHNDNHITYFAFDNNSFAACGTICFYQVMPSRSNPSCKKAFITNMYTRPKYRGKGVAYKVLDYLVYEARKIGIDEIHLDATAMGKPLYYKYGFVLTDSEMYLPKS
ncbi:MAG: GNAT family N-acetyltransferase [Lachnospiraceae bacterium]|nr:GNAT family N-acetyltransferase [Lachnospiraceae bacterium]